VCGAVNCGYSLNLQPPVELLLVLLVKCDATRSDEEGKNNWRRASYIDKY
jgi:hypothetical protein